jgi:hypothetical protein
MPIMLNTGGKEAEKTQRVFALAKNWVFGARSL